MSTSSRGSIPLSRLFLAVALSLSLSLIGLLASPGAAQEDATTADATLRIVHGVSGGPEVDILLDGQVLAEAIPFGAATDYVPIAPGDRVLQVVPSGQPGDAAIIQLDLGAEAARSYIFVAMGPLNEAEGRIFEVNLDEMTTGMARARLINGATDTGDLDLTITGGDSVFDNVGFGDGSDYVDVTPGAYSIDLRGDEDRVLGTVAEIMIEEAQAYDMVAIGQLADESLMLLTLVTTVDPSCADVLELGATAEDTCVRVTHAAPDSADVDLYVNDAIVAGGLTYGTATEFVALPSGEGRVLKVTAAGAPIEDTIIESDLTLDPGQAYEVLVSGAPDDLQLTVTGIDLRPVPEGQARLGVIHASPDAGSIDLTFADGTELFGGLEFRGVSPYIAVDEGNYELQVHPAEDQMVALASELEVEAGTVYDIVAVGRSDNQSLALLVLTAPVPLQEGIMAAPVTSISTTPESAETVVAVETLDPADDAEDQAETVIAATP
ncbi:MAG: DUF4397 domain-containing protein, partial [Chloroflexia bacterium]|nr:DUF4397 domain-containing protein [Chloroflexia bacterium]